MVFVLYTNLVYYANLSKHCRVLKKLEQLLDKIIENKQQNYKQITKVLIKTILLKSNLFIVIQILRSLSIAKYSAVTRNWNDS